MSLSSRQVIGQYSGSNTSKVSKAVEFFWALCFDLLPLLLGLLVHVDL
jgi:hypothetical protein